MNKQIALTETAVAPARGEWKHSDELIPDVACERIKIVNVAFVGQPSVGGWVLVDAGVGDCGHTIRKAAAERFGEESRPSAIILTHAHFDHIGAVKGLANYWDVPVF